MPNQFGREWTIQARLQHDRIWRLCRKAERLGSKSAKFIGGDIEVRFIEEGQEGLDLLEMEAIVEVLFFGGRV